jgi:hypothetical protein
MQAKDLNVVNLTITEDFYDYKGLFRLCTGEECLDINLVELEKENELKNIKNKFDLEEDINVIKNTIMDKVMEATTIESRIVEGKKYNESSKDHKKEGSIGSLDMA